MVRVRLLPKLLLLSSGTVLGVLALSTMTERVRGQVMNCPYVQAQLADCTATSNFASNGEGTCNSSVQTTPTYNYWGTTSSNNANEVTLQSYQINCYTTQSCIWSGLVCQIDTSATIYYTNRYIYQNLGCYPT